MSVVVWVSRFSSVEEKGGIIVLKRLGGILL